MYVSIQLVYGKICHMPVELEHKVMLGYKETEDRMDQSWKKQLNWLNELDEFLLMAYESSAIYK